MLGKSPCSYFNERSFPLEKLEGQGPIESRPAWWTPLRDDDGNLIDPLASPFEPVNL